MPKPLEALERDVLDYLVDHVRLHTYQPSVREIGSHFGIKSTKTVSEILQSLADKGWVERDTGRSRAVRLLGVDLSPQVVSVPHVDLMGEPSLRSDVENYTLDRRLAASSGSFLVTMVGDGLVGDGIRDGDLLLVEPVPPSALLDGDLVAFRQSGQGSVRRLRRLESGAVLEPGRSGEDARSLASLRDDQLLGRVAAVLRQLATDTPLGRNPEPDHDGD